MSDSTEAAEKTSGTGWGLRVCLWVTGFLLLYALSIGPVAAIFHLLALSGNDAVVAQAEPTMFMIYAPMAWIEEQIPIMQPIHDLYVSFWVRGTRWLYNTYHAMFSPASPYHFRFAP